MRVRFTAICSSEEPAWRIEASTVSRSVPIWASATRASDRPMTRVTCSASSGWETPWAIIAPAAASMRASASVNTRWSSATSGKPRARQNRSARSWSTPAMPATSAAV